MTQPNKVRDDNVAGFSAPEDEVSNIRFAVSDIVLGNIGEPLDFGVLVVDSPIDSERDQDININDIVAASAATDTGESTV